MSQVPEFDNTPLWVSKTVSRDEASDHPFVTIGAHPGDNHYEQMVGMVFGGHDEGEDAIVRARVWAASLDLYAAVELLLPLARKGATLAHTMIAEEHAFDAINKAETAMRVARNGRPEKDYD